MVYMKTKNKQESTEYLTTGRLIEAIMKYRGMDCKDLASVISEHQMNFYKILNGRRIITPQMAGKLGKALNMSPLIIMESMNLELFKQ